MVRVTGIIVPVDWDDEGNVAHLGIETFGEDFYLITAEAEGFRQLRRLLRKEVELFGHVHQAGGGKSIRVVRYAPIEPRPAGSPTVDPRANVSFQNRQ